MADNENGVGSFGWFLAGLGIGALVGVLYAPKSGKETRDDLVAGALEAKDRANKLYAQGREQVGQYVVQGKQAAAEYADKASEYVDKSRTQLNEVVDKSRTQLADYVEKGKGVLQNQAEAVKQAVDAGKEAYVAKTSEITPNS